MKLLLYDDAGHPCGWAPINIHADGTLKSGVISGSGAPATTGLTQAALYLDTATNNLWGWNTADQGWEQLTGN